MNSKISVIFVCLVAISTVTRTNAETPYTVECTSVESATVTLRDGWTLIGHDGCTPTAATNGVYILDSSCVSNQRLVIKPAAISPQANVAVSYQFQLHCRDYGVTEGSRKTNPISTFPTSMVTRTSTHDTLLPYTIVCTSVDSATITLRDGWTLTGHDGCTPTAVTNGVYILDSSCLSHQRVVIKSPATINSGQDYFQFQVNCQDYGVTKVVNQTVVVKGTTLRTPETHSTSTFPTPMGGQTNTQSTNPLYTVECISERAATVAFKDDTYTLIGTDGCKPFGPSIDSSSGGHTYLYHLGHDCFPNKTLIVEPKTASFSMVENIHVFQVVCQHDGMVMLITDRTRVSGPSPSQEIHSIPLQRPDVRLQVLDHIPTSSAFDSTLDTVRMGQTLFLTIMDTHNTDILLPKSCSVTKDSFGTKPHVLWEMDGSVCIKEPSIVKSPMILTANSGNGTSAYLEMEAFKFSHDESALVTFSCQVRVCSDVTSGMCKVDYEKFQMCQTKTANNPSPPVKRQRRQADNGVLSHGKVQQLTATLAIHDGVMSPVTGGSSTTSLSLLCLLLPFLTRIIL